MPSRGFWSSSRGGSRTRGRAPRTRRRWGSDPVAGGRGGDSGHIQAMKEQPGGHGVEAVAPEGDPAGPRRAATARPGADGSAAMARRPRRQDGAAWCCSRATWASGQAGHPERWCLSPRPWRANVRGWRRRLVEPGDAAAAASRRAATTCRRRAWDGQRVSPVVPPAVAEVVPAGTADRATCRRSHPHVDPPPADPAEQNLCRAADAVAYPLGDVELAGKELQRRRTRHHG